MKTYGSDPVEIASDVIVDNSEMYFYQYLPIHITGGYIAIPEQLRRLNPIINIVLEDFYKNFGKWFEYKIYLTAKCLYVKGGENINRMGWHCDGFMSDDINYIWSDTIPTEYVTGEYQLKQDHQKSIEQMNRLFYHSEPLKCKPNSIYRLDETVIHRCDYNRSKHAVLRHFVKVSFSKDRYNLKGNSHNYLLNYNWDMEERDEFRNHPSKQTK